MWQQKPCKQEKNKGEHSGDQGGEQAVWWSEVSVEDWLHTGLNDRSELTVKNDSEETGKQEHIQIKHKRKYDKN